MPKHDSIRILLASVVQPLRIAVLLILAGHLSAQNLVPNPSFEILSQCPPQCGVPGTGPTEAVPWHYFASADIFNPCTDPNWCGAPDNFQGHQDAFDGVGYGGGYYHSYSGALHEFLYTELLDTLEADKCYKVSAWINLADEGCGCDQAGLLLTPDEPLVFTGTPQVSWNGGFITDQVNWTNILGYHVAVGNELYISVGNFVSSSGTNGDPSCWGPQAYCYYYVDQVEVIEVPFEQVSVDLGPPVTVCDSFIIDPGGDPDIVYVWNTGHQGHTLTVYTSGVYSVTASYGCTFAEGDIDVTILYPQIVDIGPEALLLCEGDAYEISLNPDLGTYEWQDGSDDPEYSITTGGVYMVTLDDGCTLSSDTIEVTMQDVPLVFSLGPDTTLCVGDEFTINVDPSLGDFTWQDGSDDPFYTIDDDGTYALTISNMCGEQTDEIEVLPLNAPVIELGPDMMTLCSGEIVDFDFEPDMGSYLWQDGSTFPYYTVTSPGIIGVTVTNICGTESDMLEVVYEATPQIFLGPDLMACPGDTIILSVGSNTGQFQWEDGSTTSTHTVTATGQYGVTITNGCGTASDEIGITYAPMITPPDLGPDLSLCPGDVQVLYANVPGANYLWNDMSIADSLVVTTGGTYSVQVYNLCASYSDTVQVQVNSNAPLLQLPADFALCAGQMITLNPGLTGVNYLWNDGSTMPTLTVSQPGIISLTVSNACGSSIDTVVITAGDALPVVDLGTDVSICQGDTVIITPVSDHVSEWLWQDGTMNSTYVVTGPGVVFVEASNSCATVYDTLSVGLLPAIPSLDLGPDQSICPGASVTLLINTPNVDILWPDGSTGNAYIVSDSAEVMASISNVCGQEQDTVAISLLPETPPLNLGADQTICPGELVIYDPGIAGVTYLWNDGSTGTTYQTTQGGVVALTITGVCGSVSDTVILTESTDGPQLDLGPDLSGCEGEIITIPAGISGVQYLWQDGSSDNEISVMQSGTYSLTVTNACGSDTDTVLVSFTMLPPAQALGPDTLLCEGERITLMAVNAPGAQLIWQDNSGATSFVVTMPGTYYVVASNECGEETDTVKVGYLDAPDPFSLGPDMTICPGETVELVAPTTANQIQWQDGSVMSGFVVTDAGIYWLRVSNECGALTDSVEISVDTRTPVLNLEPELLWCPGDQFVIDAGQSFPAQYTWSTGAVTSAITVSTPGVYSVEVYTPCLSVTDQTDISPETDCPDGPVFYIPNVFSPNGDGVNDVFTVLTDLPDQVIAMTGTIYDRWGNLVFSKATTSFEWDGRFNDNLMNPGVYVYVIQVRYIGLNGQTEKTFKGDVTLVR